MPHLEHFRSTSLSGLLFSQVLRTALPGTQPGADCNPERRQAKPISGDIKDLESEGLGLF